ncbi:MAG: 50S ribosomal protein L5 [Puniceicoccaceae bacterium]|nr:MAG: 50S ribosomal protein L5 [Puniceicoccaceae bacterium]
MSKPYLKTYYHDTVLPELMKLRGYKNVHQVPRIEKIILNTGISAVAEKSVLADAIKEMSLIAGQRPVQTKARMSVSNFKLRKGMPIGCKVTLRGDRMYDFLYRLIMIALPMIRDFRGVSGRLDGNGNYSIGVADATIFPEITVEGAKKHAGMDITIVTTAKTDPEGRELLRLLGMPFRRSEPVKSTAA